MSTLQELIRQRQREIVASPLKDQSVKTPGPSLRVFASNGELWGFPWAHFIYVRALTCEAREVMSVVFVSHEVAVFGQRLIGLAEEVADQRLIELRASKNSYATKDSYVCWIDLVEVFAREELRKKNEAIGSVPSDE